MFNYKCTRCGWQGTDADLVKVPVCPECSTGHSKLNRIQKKADELECPNCSWRGYDDEIEMENECPKCGDEYLKEVS